jgi:hypothetical protein
VCNSKCKTCITYKSCWADATYGSPADLNCNNWCYTSCGDYWDASSSLCDCSHNFCVFGCPENCTPPNSLTTCNADCMENGKTAVECNGICAECVTTKSCWADAVAYGDAGDLACWNDCYTTCETNLGAGSDLCSCAHGFCVMGCPQHCNPSNLTTCNVDCIATSSDPVTCQTWCHNCVNTLTCWTPKVYGGFADTACFHVCYKNCAAELGSSSSLCDCTVVACRLGCPQHCAPGVLTTCNTDCMAKVSAPLPCSLFCANCVRAKGCWVTRPYGDFGDIKCFNTCYDKCGTFFEATSKLC